MRVSWDMTSMRATTWARTRMGTSTILPAGTHRHLHPRSRDLATSPRTTRQTFALQSLERGRKRGLDRLSGARASTEITFHARRIADARGLAGQSGKEKDKMDYSSKRARPRRPSSAPECAIRRLQIDLFVRHILTFTFVFTISLGERGRIGITLILAEEYVLSILTCA